MAQPPFVIFGLPRSRTRWLAAFLTYGGWSCGHDEARHARSLDDVRSWLAQPCTGTAETAAAAFWRLLLQVCPDVRVVVIRRPVDAVLASTLALGIPFDVAGLAASLRRMDAKLDQIERRVAGVLSVPFADLADEAVCARVFEHCLGLAHDPAWWRALAPVNIQADLLTTIRYFNAHKAQLDKLAAVAKHRMLAAIERQGAPALTGITFQQEPFATFYRDAKDCFAEHLVQTGQAPDDHARKNLPMLQALDALGALSITTARSNGRIFGYLMAVCGPSLDSPDVTQAWNTIFFASPDYRGLGIQLQRASLAALRARGVNEVLMRAGVRGAGPRLGSLYKRLGAEDFGQVYRLQLEA